MRRHVVVDAGGVIGRGSSVGRRDQRCCRTGQHTGALGDSAPGDLLQQALRRRGLRVVGSEIGQPTGRWHRRLAPIGAEQRDGDHLAPVVV